MRNEVITQGPLNIPKRLSEQFSYEKLRDTLLALNQISGHRYYFIDFCRQKIIVDSPVSPILCGNQIEFLVQKGFDFYERIMSNKCDERWFAQMNKEAFTIFYSFPVKERLKLVHTCNVCFEFPCGSTKILQHKLVPYKLCKNGNLWIGLCCLELSTSRSLCESTIVNTLPGGLLYEFCDSTFYRSAPPLLTSEEYQIMECFVKGLTAKEICLHLTVSLSMLKRMKRMLYKKMGVRNSVQAVSWAHSKGII